MHANTPSPAKPNNPDKPTKKSDRTKRPTSPPRRKNRFNEREFARACRAARAVGADKVSCDPKTGIYTITFPDKDAAARTDAEKSPERAIRP